MYSPKHHNKHLCHPLPGLQNLPLRSLLSANFLLAVLLKLESIDAYCYPECFIPYLFPLPSIIALICIFTFDIVC